MADPAGFAHTVGDRLESLIQENEPFAAALCGVFDLAREEMRLAGAGNSPPLVARADGSWEEPQVFGVPLGLMRGATYEQTTVPLHPGDGVMFFTDGASEIAVPNEGEIGTEGLRKILQSVGYPAVEPPFDEIESRLLEASDRIRFDDDLTFLSVQLHSSK